MTAPNDTVPAGRGPVLEDDVWTRDDLRVCVFVGVALLLPLVGWRVMYAMRFHFLLHGLGSGIGPDVLETAARVAGVAALALATLSQRWMLARMSPVAWGTWVLGGLAVLLLVAAPFLGSGLAALFFVSCWGPIAWAAPWSVFGGIAADLMSARRIMRVMPASIGVSWLALAVKRHAGDLYRVAGVTTAFLAGAGLMAVSALLLQVVARNLGARATPGADAALVRADSWASVVRTPYARTLLIWFALRTFLDVVDEELLRTRAREIGVAWSSAGDWLYTGQAVVAAAIGILAGSWLMHRVGVRGLVVASPIVVLVRHLVAALAPSPPWLLGVLASGRLLSVLEACTTLILLIPLPRSKRYLGLLLYGLVTQAAVPVIVIPAAVAMELGVLFWLVVVIAVGTAVMGARAGSEYERAMCPEARTR